MNKNIFRNWFIYVLGFIFLTSTSCSFTEKKKLNARVVASQTALDVDLEKKTQDIVDLVNSDIFNSTTCLEYLKNFYKQFENFDVKNVSAEELEKTGPAVINNLWQARLSLHKKLSTLSSSCVQETKNTFRIIRFSEDYIAERIYKIQDLIPSQIIFQNQPIPLKESKDYYLVQNGIEQPTQIKLQPGDVMIARGISFLSAMIARLSDIDSQFSHIVFIANDPKDNQLKTIESYVGEGVNFYEMDFALKNENARLLILRPKREDWAKSSAIAMADLLRAKLDQNKKIKYDYKLDFEDPKTMSCAEVATVAYGLGDKLEAPVPLFAGSLHSGKPVLNSIGLKEGKTFSPGDLESDPRFDIVGEFRDLRLTRDSRQKDAVLTVITKWMDEKNYKLIKSAKSRLVLPLWLARKTPLWPLVRKMTKVQNFSKEVPVKMLRTLQMMSSIGEILLAEIQIEDKKFQKLTGWPMTYRDMYESLENFRLKDLALYKNKKSRKLAKLHALLRESN